MNRNTLTIVSNILGACARDKTIEKGGQRPG